MTHTFFTFSAHAVLGKPRWTQHLLIHKTNYSVTMNMKRWRGEACWLWSEEQRHRVIWLLARFQLPELKIAAKFRTSFTPWVSRRCRVKPALSSTRRSQLKGRSSCGTEDVQSRHSTIFGSKDWSSGTCWPVFLQNSYNTLLFFEQAG